MFLQILLESGTDFITSEKGNAMRFLTGTDFGSGKDCQSGFSSQRLYFRTLQGSVMIGYGNDIQSAGKCRFDNDRGTHIQASTRRKTGMNMQIGPVEVHPFCNS